MNQSEYLNLLLNTLRSFKPLTLQCLGSLANDLESIRSSLHGQSSEFDCAAQQLWEALEVIGVKHQEQGTALTDAEERDLKLFVDRLVALTIGELESKPFDLPQ